MNYAAFIGYVSEPGEVGKMENYLRTLEGKVIKDICGGFIENAGHIPLTFPGDKKIQEILEPYVEPFTETGPLMLTAFRAEVIDAEKLKQLEEEIHKNNIEIKTYSI